MSRARHFVLNSAGEPVPAALMDWARFIETRANVVKQESFGDSAVSTIFLGLDHSFGDGPPILWETMVIGGPLAWQQSRCSGGREQAEAMHQDMVERLQAVLALKE